MFHVRVIFGHSHLQKNHTKLSLEEISHNTGHLQKYHIILSIDEISHSTVTLMNVTQNLHRYHISERTIVTTHFQLHCYQKRLEWTVGNKDCLQALKYYKLHYMTDRNTVTNNNCPVLTWRNFKYKFVIICRTVRQFYNMISRKKYAAQRLSPNITLFIRCVVTQIVAF